MYTALVVTFRAGEFGVYFFYCSFFHESICLTPSSDVEHMLEKKIEKRDKGENTFQRPKHSVPPRELFPFFFFPSRSRRSFEYRFATSACSL